MVGTCEGVGDMFSRKTEDVNERNVNSIVESWNYLHQETKNTLNDDSDENSFFFFFYGCGDKCWVFYLAPLTLLIVEKCNILQEIYTCYI